MYCPNCGKEIADEAVVCIGCGRPVQPLRQPISQPVPGPATGQGWSDKLIYFFLFSTPFLPPIGIIAGIVGLFKKETRTVARSILIFGLVTVVLWATTTPVGGIIISLICAFIGYFSRGRLFSSKASSGQPVVAGSSSNIAGAVTAGMPVVANQKKCPSCGNSIPIEAKICQYCRQSFSEEEIETAKKQLEADLAQKRAEALEMGRINQGKTLRIVGVIVAVIGVLVLLLFVVVQFSPTTSADSAKSFIYADLFCPIPLILLGGGLFAWGTYSLRKLKEEKEKSKPIQTISI